MNQKQQSFGGLFYVGSNCCYFSDNYNNNNPGGLKIPGDNWRGILNPFAVRLECT